MTSGVSLEITLARGRQAGVKECRVARGPWHGYEYVKGYGIFGLPFSSGHVRALRVFPQNDFSPYITIWHRNPAGDWAIYYHAVAAQVACHRYYGAAARVNASAQIDVVWEGPDRLRVRMDHPALEWTVAVQEPPLLRLMNALSRRLPFWTWKHEALRVPREWNTSARGGRWGRWGRGTDSIVARPRGFPRSPFSPPLRRGGTWHTKRAEQRLSLPQIGNLQILSYEIHGEGADDDETYRNGRGGGVTSLHLGDVAEGDRRVPDVVSALDPAMERVTPDGDPVEGEHSP